jgi:hypothetical protein
LWSRVAGSWKVQAIQYRRRNGGREPAVMTGVTSAAAVRLGMDTSKDAIVVAVLLPGEELPAVDRIVNREESVRRLIGRFGDRGRLRACYEAGPGGYDLYRLLASIGVACEVVSPLYVATSQAGRASTRSPVSRCCTSGRVSHPSMSSTSTGTQARSSKATASRPHKNEARPAA